MPNNREIEEDEEDEFAWEQPENQLNNTQEVTINKIKEHPGYDEAFMLNEGGPDSENDEKDK
jgi:hypothetical protein